MTAFHRTPSPPRVGETGRGQWPPPAFDVMAKPAGARCNLVCSYCYYRDREDRVPGASMVMSDEVLESFVQQYIEAQQVPEVSFGWQGGEPLLMGIPFYQHAVDLQNRYAPAGMRVNNYFQTNGTLLDDAWGAFFRENGFVVGISVDGPRAMHDAFRVDAAGRGSSTRVTSALSVLKRNGVELNAMTCVHAANVEHPLEVYRYLRDEVGARFIQLIPVVELLETPERDGRIVTPETVDPKAFGLFLATLFDDWVRCDVGRVFVQLFDVMLAAWVGAPPGLCAFAPTCGAALVLEHDGDLYACDHFVTPEHRLGNILETPLVELVGLGRQERFGLAKAADLPNECLGCPIRFACNGDCPKHRVQSSASDEPAQSYLCESYRAFLSRAAPCFNFMANEIANRRSPARIMDALREVDSKRRG